MPSPYTPTSYTDYSAPSGTVQQVSPGAGAAPVRQKINKVDAWAQGQLNSPQAGQTPLLTNAGRESWDLGAGTVKAVGGTLGGDWGQAKQGLKQAGGSILSALTAGSLRGLNQAPPAQYLGGSADALAQRQQQYQQGIGQAGGVMGQGLGTSGTGGQMLGQAGGLSMQDRTYGYGLAGQGLDTQMGALNAARQLAGQSTDSLAQAQLQQGLAQQQQQMLGQAAQARGGNQAAALRNAQMLGSQAGLQTNQAAAMLRAQEQQAQLARQLGVEQLAQQAGATQLGLGLGAAQQGTQNYGTFGGQLGSLGLGQSQVGLGSQGQFLDAQSAADKAQLEADTKSASAGQEAKGGIMGVAGKIIGGILG
jgi:hypothetical protein